MAARQKNDILQGTLALLVLKTLAANGPMHGYAITAHIQRVSADLLRVEEGSLYPALQRMLKSGWLKSEMGTSARNRPVRIYKLEPAGRKRLEQERSSFEKMFAGIHRVLAVAQS